jgi:tripartite-type tricarboxylate transporter receptor subunit TctC
MRRPVRGRRRIWLLAFAGALALPGAASGADAWPTKPVHILVAGPPGGTVDVLARMVADDLARALGGQVSVDNRPGASGVIAVRELLAAPADGHAFLLIQRGIASEVPYVMKLRFDPLADLQPLVQVTRQALLLVGSTQLPPANLAELVAYARSRPQPLAYAAVGAGLRTRTLGDQFAHLAGVDLEFVDYQGGPAALRDVLGGHVPLLVDTPAILVPLLRAGRLRAYATTGSHRSAALPDVPTFTEAGYPELEETSWFALWSRPGVPQDVRDRVRDLVLRLLERPQTLAMLGELGLEPGLPLTPAELARDAREAHERHGKVLRAIGFAPD